MLCVSGSAQAHSGDIQLRKLNTNLIRVPACVLISVREVVLPEAPHVFVEYRADPVYFFFVVDDIKKSIQSLSVALLETTKPYTHRIFAPPMRLTMMIGNLCEYLPEGPNKFASPLK